MHCFKGTICNYHNQQKFRISSHLRQKEVLSSTIFQKKSLKVFGSNYLKVSVSFDKNFLKSIVL